ncbi:MAG TPA: OmpH family outer membrane protein [Candidatus Binataceae bacterium]|nr:OmpH family outer membrane protein [Candidatus Binataceae bacterium]
MNMTLRPKSVAITLIAVAAALGFPLSRAWAVPAGEMKYAFVDVQRALNDCRNGKAVKAEFRGKIEHLQERLQGEQAEVERLQKELKEKGALMQPDQRQNLEDEYTKKLHEFQDDYKNSRDDLKQKDNEMTGEIVQDIALVVQQIGEKNGYTMVFEKGGLLWAIPQIDITDEVVRAYDAMNVKPGGLLQKAISSGGNFGSNVGASSAPGASEPPAHGSSTITK